MPLKGALCFFELRFDKLMAWLWQELHWTQQRFQLLKLDFPVRSEPDFLFVIGIMLCDTAEKLAPFCLT